MGSYVNQMPNDEAFWISLVETNMRLGWEECLVPFNNLDAPVAEQLAKRLGVQLEVSEDGFIFKKEQPWLRQKPGAANHHSSG